MTQFMHGTGSISRPIGTFFWVLGWFTDSVLSRAAVTLALAFATGFFAYSQVFMAHAPAALCLFAGFALIFAVAHPHRAPRWMRIHPLVTASVSGLLLGTAALLEYQTAVAAAAIGVYTVVRTPRLWPTQCLAALPPVAAILFCNWVEYHSPISTGYGAYYASHAQQYGHTIAGLRWPPPGQALVGLTISPFRGLFFLSPFLALSLVGLAVWWREWRSEACLVCAVVAGYLLIIAMHPIWWGGISIGPRLLLPAVPFLCAPLATVLDGFPRVRPIFYTLVAAALLNVWAQTLGGSGFPAEHYSDPLVQYSVPAILAGTVRANFGSLLTAPFGAPYSPFSLVMSAALLLTWSAYVLRPSVWLD